MLENKEFYLSQLAERAAKEKFHDICQELTQKAKANRKLLELTD